MSAAKEEIVIVEKTRNGATYFEVSGKPVAAFCSHQVSIGSTKDVTKKSLGCSHKVAHGSKSREVLELAQAEQLCSTHATQKHKGAGTTGEPCGHETTKNGPCKSIKAKGKPYCARHFNDEELKRTTKELEALKATKAPKAVAAK